MNILLAFKSLIINKGSWSLLLVFVFLILPKFNLIQVSDGFSTGIRVDDLIIFVLFLFFYKELINPVASGQKLFYIFLFFSFISALVSLVLHNNFLGVIYPFRWLEYFIFFLTGVYLSRNNYSLFGVMVMVFTLHSGISLFQYYGLVGAISSSYGGVVSEAYRAMGLTGGPWELAPFINLLVLMILFELWSSNKIIIAAIIVFIGLIVIFMTSSRIGVLAYLMSLFYFIGKQNIKVLMVFMALIPGIVLLSLPFLDRLIERSQGLLDIGSNIEYILGYYNEAVPFSSIYYSGSFSESGDLSWQMRIYKWVVAFKSYLSDVWYVLWGVGPGMWGAALDGGWIRTLTENGIIGLTLFTISIFMLIRSSLLFAFFLVMSFNMIFIDINYASKFMSLYFLLTGYYFIKVIERNEYECHHSYVQR